MSACIVLRDDYDSLELWGLAKRSPDTRQVRRLLTQEQMSELSVIVETGPYPEVDGVVRWRRIDLKRVIAERFGVIYSERTISDLLAALSFSHITGRLQHPKQDERVIEAFKKLSPHPGGSHRRSAQDQAGRDLVSRRG